MKREQLIEKLKATRPALEAQGVTHVALFGSRSRGDFRHDSDLDILLDVAPQSRFNMLDLVGVERFSVERHGIGSQCFHA